MKKGAAPVKYPGNTIPVTQSYSVKDTKRAKREVRRQGKG